MRKTICILIALGLLAAVSVPAFAESRGGYRGHGGYSGHGGYYGHSGHGVGQFFAGAGRRGHPWNHHRELAGDGVLRAPSAGVRPAGAGLGAGPLGGTQVTRPRGPRGPIRIIRNVAHLPSPRTMLTTPAPGQRPPRGGFFSLFQAIIFPPRDIDRRYRSIEVGIS